MISTLCSLVFLYGKDIFCHFSSLLVNLGCVQFNSTIQALTSCGIGGDQTWLQCRLEVIAANYQGMLFYFLVQPEWQYSGDTIIQASNILSDQTLPIT